MWPPYSRSPAPRLQPTHAAAPRPGTIQLTLSAAQPTVATGTDNNELLYSVHITNHGPATATGVVVHVSAWLRPGRLWNSLTCEKLIEPYNVPLDPMTPGALDIFPATVPLPDVTDENIQFFAEVVKANQIDSKSVPGTCEHGLHPQPDCVSVVTGV